MNLKKTFIKNISDPLWAIKDRSPRHSYWKRIETTQYLNRSDLLAMQKQRFVNIIRYAYENTIYYKQLFDSNGIKISSMSELDGIKQIPFLTKEIIKHNCSALISQKYKKQDLLCAKTGGSTGESLTLYIDYEANEMRNATARRSDRWAGWDIGEPIASIWGNPPVVKTTKEKLRHEFLKKVIYLDTMNLNDGSMREFIKLWRKVKPTLLFGHAHSIYMFASFCKDHEIIELRPKGIISTSMMLLENERNVIEEVFSCKVTNRYGCEEASLIACECEEHYGMHLNIEHLFIEFVRSDGEWASPGEEGEIVITDLMNKGMPFIRYRVGDWGIPAIRKCACGRGLPLMEKVVGRVADFLVKKDNSKVAGISLIERTLTKIKGIKQMQLIQDAVDSITLNIVRDESFNDSTKYELLNELRIVFGSIVYKVNYMNAIPQERNGKYRFAICRVGDTKNHE